MNTLFINTRPLHRSYELSAHFDGSSVQVANLPLLTIKDLPLTPATHTMMDALIAGHYHALVVTSVESAKRAIRHLQNLNDHATIQAKLSATPIVAVGAATARVLQDFNLPAILPATANNEGMLKLPVIHNLQSGDAVLIWRGTYGRRLLQDTLVQKGVRTDAIEWYERVMPQDLADNYQKIAPQIKQRIATKTPVFTLITSQMAFEHWQNLADPLSLQIHYLTLGERLHDIVQSAYPTACVQLIDDLNPAHIALQMNKICQNLA